MLFENSGLIHYSEISTFLTRLKDDGYQPLSVSIVSSLGGYDILLAFNDNPDFYISDKKLRITNLTADGSEFILNVDQSSLEAIYDVTPDDKNISLSISSRAFCATIDFLKL